MNKGRYRWFLRMAIPLVLALGVFVWFLTQEGTRQLTIENRSGQTITRLEVVIAGQAKVFEDIPSGAARTAVFRVQGDARYLVQGELGELPKQTRIRGAFASPKDGPGGKQLTLTVLPGGSIQVRSGKDSAR